MEISQYNKFFWLVLIVNKCYIATKGILTGNNLMLAHDKVDCLIQELGLTVTNGSLFFLS